MNTSMMPRVQVGDTLVTLVMEGPAIVDIAFSATALGTGRARLRASLTTLLEEAAREVMSQTAADVAAHDPETFRDRFAEVTARPLSPVSSPPGPDADPGIHTMDDVLAFSRELDELLAFSTADEELTQAQASAEDLLARLPRALKDASGTAESRLVRLTVDALGGVREAVFLPNKGLSTDEARTDFLTTYARARAEAGSSLEHIDPTAAAAMKGLSDD